MFSQAEVEKDLALQVNKSGIRNKNAIKGQISGLLDCSLSLTEAPRDAEKQVCSLFSMTLISRGEGYVLNFPNFSIRLVEGITGYQNQGGSLNA